MAERRMFSMKIVDSDAFLEMPLSAQALYFHLGMRADDDGFLGNGKRILRTIGANEDDMKLLFHKRFMIAFDNSVAVIKHWQMHNYIRKDRYKPTSYTEYKNQLLIKSNQSYTLQVDIPTDNQVSTNGQPNDIPTVDVGKVRVGKGSIGKNNTLSGKPDFVYADTVDYLNDKAGTHYKHTSAKTRRLIDARISDGFKFKDFQTVIDNKTQEWLSTDMEKYLRPETLFGTKFESYLNQKNSKSKPTIEWFADYLKEKE